MEGRHLKKKTILMKCLGTPKPNQLTITSKISLIEEVTFKTGHI